jgi:hypothetical protein
MTEVRHPRADRDASPAAVTVGTNTYSVDADGVIDCPDSEVSAVADVLADVYGVDRDRILTNADAESGSVLVNADDKSDAMLIDAGVCPWCDEYDGDNVGLHASRAHPDQWADYKDDGE